MRPSLTRLIAAQVANMLYLESPAGSGDSSGFSTCIKGGKPVRCHWDDVSQGEAYAHTLAAFYRAFPEFKANPLYLTGESYFGHNCLSVRFAPTPARVRGRARYGPNIANWILTHAPFNTSLPLKGIALGNACWGGDAHSVKCNGPNEEQNDIDMFFGKGLISKKLYEQVYDACSFPLHGMPALACDAMLTKAHAAVGPHNVYNIYDNCGGAVEADLRKSGEGAAALTRACRAVLLENSHRRRSSTRVLALSRFTARPPARWLVAPYSRCRRRSSRFLALSRVRPPAARRRRPLDARPH
eukprot:3876347-Prymnesium_polylepis.1